MHSVGLEIYLLPLKREARWSYLVFFKQLVFNQLALGWQIVKQLSGLNLLSLSNKKIID